MNNGALVFISIVAIVPIVAGDVNNDHLITPPNLTMSQPIAKSPFFKKQLTASQPIPIPTARRQNPRELLHTGSQSPSSLERTSFISPCTPKSPSNPSSREISPRSPGSPTNFNMRYKQATTTSSSPLGFSPSFIDGTPSPLSVIATSALMNKNEKSDLLRKSQK